MCPIPQMSNAVMFGKDYAQSRLMSQTNTSTWNRNARTFLMASLIYAVALIALPALHANSIPLAWNPSVNPNVTGYKIYYGVASGVYTSSVDVSNVTNATITGLSQNTAYYFATKSYDVVGDSSPFSNEIKLMVYSPASLTQTTNVNGRFGFDVSGPANVIPAVTNVIPAITNVIPAITNVVLGVTNVVPAITNIVPIITNVVLGVTNYLSYLYVVQASTNLINWVPVQTNIAPFVFMDTNSTQFSHRFFRTVNIPSPTISATLAFASTNPFVNGQFTTMVYGPTNFPLQYVVQASTDLVNWVSIQTNTSPFTFVDTNASKFSRRFYRTYH